MQTREREETNGTKLGCLMEYRLTKLAQYVRGWMKYFGISQYYRPIPELDEWLRRRVRTCNWKTRLFSLRDSLLLWFVVLNEEFAIRCEPPLDKLLCALWLDMKEADSHGKHFVKFFVSEINRLKFSFLELSYPRPHE